MKDLMMCKQLNIKKWNCFSQIQSHCFLIRPRTFSAEKFSVVSEQCQKNLEIYSEEGMLLNVLIVSFYNDQNFFPPIGTVIWGSVPTFVLVCIPQCSFSYIPALR
jgi:hypothetical protein